MCRNWITFDEGYRNDPIHVMAKMFEKAQGVTPPMEYRKLSEKLTFPIVILRDGWLGHQVGEDCMLRAYNPYIGTTWQSDSYFIYQAFCSNLLANVVTFRFFKI